MSDKGQNGDPEDDELVDPGRPATYEEATTDEFFDRIGSGSQIIEDPALAELEAYRDRYFDGGFDETSGRPTRRSDEIVDDALSEFGGTDSE